MLDNNTSGSMAETVCWEIAAINVVPANRAASTLGQVL